MPDVPSQWKPFGTEIDRCEPGLKQLDMHKSKCVFVLLTTMTSWLLLTGGLIIVSVELTLFCYKKNLGANLDF